MVDVRAVCGVGLLAFALSGGCSPQSEEPVSIPIDHTDAVRDYLRDVAAEDPGVSTDWVFIEQVVRESTDPLAVLQAVRLFQYEEMGDDLFQSEKSRILDLLRTVLQSSPDLTAATVAINVTRELVQENIITVEEVRPSLETFVANYRGTTSRLEELHVQTAQHLLSGSH